MEAPLDPSAAVAALEAARDREQIFELVLRATRSRTRFAALLSVHADHVRGRRALADGFDTSRVSALRISRHTVPAFEAAIASRAPFVGAIRTGEQFVDGLLEDLGGAPGAVLVLPVTVATRTVALVVAHRGEGALALADVSELVPVIEASNPALARVVATRSKAVRASDDEVEISVTSGAGRREALAAHRAQEAWAEAADTIRELVRDGVETGDPDEDEQLALLLELGKLEHERLGRPERAIEAWRSAQTIDAGDTRVLDALEAVFVEQGRWHECVELLEKRAALTEGTKQRIAVLLNLAAIANERLEDEERAIETYERILKWAPEHEVASQQLESLYWSRKQWEPLATLLLERASRHDDPETRITALESVAQMYEDKVGDAHAAFLVWVAVCRREPERPHLIEHLDRLAPAADAWDEVVAECGTLADELDAQHPAAAASLLHLVGRWARDRLANHDAAIRALERALRLQPSNLDAFYELLELLRANGRWTDMVALLSQRAETEQDPHRRAELYAELGDVHDARLAQPAEAIACYERALADDPEASAVLVALHRLYLATEQWEPLGELLPRLIDVISSTAGPAMIVELLVELGGVLADRLGRPDDAVQAYRDALAIDPGHAGALAAIERAYRATGQTDALLDTIEAAIETAPAAEQATRYAEVAAAWQAHGRCERAAAAWRRVIELEPRDLAAHRGLARALGDARQWPALVVAMHVQLRLLAEPADRLALLLELADVFETRLGDLDGATAAYREVVAIEAGHPRALDALARLHDHAGRLQPALDALGALLEQTPSGPARADLLQRIGHVQLAAHDATNARLSFVQALALDLDNARAREGMARVQILQGELVAAGEELVRAAQLSTHEPDTIRCLADAAWLYRHRLGDTARARECLLVILELDPDHADARQALAELLAETEQWESLWPHLVEQVRRVRDDEAIAADERLDTFRKAARCALELGDVAAALELYDAACELDSTPASLLDRADAQYRGKDLEGSAASYQTIVARCAQVLERPQLATVYRRLAVIHTGLGKLPQAQHFHHKVLELEPAQRDTLADLVELHLSRGHVDEAIATLRSLAAGAPAAERPPYLERIGDLYRDKQRNRPRALSTYLEALELDGTNRRILQRVLDLQSEAGQWKQAVETIERFLATEADPARRGAYHLASAEIRRTELKDRAGALAAYEHALDELLHEQPLRETTRARALSTFRLIDELAAADAGWKYLEQAYRRMIKRLPAGDPELVHLWDALGEIYRARLQHPQSAIEAFEVAHSLDPDRSPQRARVLAELYARAGGEQPVSDRAAKLVETDPTNPDAYRALGIAALEGGRIDEAWCVARALTFLKKASSKEQALYRQYQAQEVRKASGILDDDAWGMVRHAGEDQVLSSLFALIWEAPVALRAGPARSFELRSRERMPVEHDTRIVAKTFRHAARLLNVSLPDVFVQPRRAGRLLLANVLEKGRIVPTIIVGRDLMTGYRDTELAAAIGAMIAQLRHAYYLKLALTSLDELEAAVAAAGRLAGRQLGRPELEPRSRELAAELERRVSPATAEAIRALVDRLPEALDLARWRTAVDVAAQRAALLVSGDLAATARMISSETSVLGGMRPAQRVQELVAYSVSPGYFALRRHLDLAVA